MKITLKAGYVETDTATLGLAADQDVTDENLQGFVTLDVSVYASQPHLAPPGPTIETHTAFEMDVTILAIKVIGTATITGKFGEYSTEEVKNIAVDLSRDTSWETSPDAKILKRWKVVVEDGSLLSEFEVQTIDFGRRIVTLAAR